MSNKRISELTALTTSDNADELVIDDVSEPAATKTKKQTKLNLLKEVNTRIDDVEDDISDISDDLATVTGDLGSHIANTSNPHGVTKSQVGLGNVDNTSDANKPVSTATQTALNLKIDLTQKGANNGVATLDSGGKVPSSQLPAIGLTDVYVVVNQAAQLALTAQEGDVAVRTDQNKSYIHNGGTSGTMSDWQELLTPTDAVLSVNGMTGAVTIGAGGSNTQVQFNDGGAFGGDSGLTYNKASDTLTATGGFITPGIVAAELGVYLPRGARIVLCSEDDGFDYVYASDGTDGFEIDTMIFGTNSNMSGKNKWVWINGEDQGVSASLVGQKFGLGVSEPLYSIHVSTNQPEIYLHDSVEDIAWRMVNSGGLGTLVYGSATVIETDNSSVNYSAPGATGTMDFYQNNISRIHVHSNGNVGINTTSGDRALEVNLGTSNAFRLSYNDSNGSAATYLDVTVSSVGVVTHTAVGSAPQFAFSHDIIGPTAGFKIIGGTSTTADLTFQVTTGVGTTGADMHFLVGNNGATEAMTILNSGFVGIGTNAPVAKLQVSNGASTAQDIFRMGYSTSVYMKMAQLSNGRVNITVIGSVPYIQINNPVYIPSTFQVSAINNDAGLAHDVFTPQVIDKFNLSDVTFDQGQYMRVGNVVTLSGLVSGAVPDTTGTCRVRFDVPIATVFSYMGQLAGTGVSKVDGLYTTPVALYPDLEGSQIEAWLEWEGVGGTENQIQFHLTYYVQV